MRANRLPKKAIHQCIMFQRKKGPSTLYFEARKYFFWLKWQEFSLQIEAVNKNELARCFRGQLKADEKVLRELFQFLQIHSYRQSLGDSKADELSLIITIIDMSEQGKGYACRIILNNTIKEIKVEPTIVSETYFLTKKIEALQFQKKNDRMMMASFGNELTKKLEEKDEDIKKTFAQQMQGMISAVTTRIEKEFQYREKALEKRKKTSDDDETAEGLNIKKIEKKLRKRIKKQLKERKREKKLKRLEKKKKRKERRKEKKRLQALLQKGQLPEEPVVNQIQIPQDSPNSQPPLFNNLQNFPFHEQNPNNFLNVDEIDPVMDVGVPEQSKQKKKKKQKHKHKHQRHEAQPIVVQPQVTSLNHMAKLRNRGGDLLIPLRTQQLIEVIDDTEPREKKEKKSKQKKNKHKEKKKQNKNEVQQLQEIEEAGEKQYYKRLEEIRKSGNIDQVRVARANRQRPVLAPPKQPLTQVDEFNPKYNGEPRYKAFFGLNEYQIVRPGEIFVHRNEDGIGLCKKIPAIFRQQIPSFKHYQVNGSVIRKKSGLNYQQMVFDYTIQSTGRHVVVMRVIDSKRMYIWFGVIDLREKDREESYNKKNCITFSFRTGHVASSNKWSKNKTGRIDVGLTVRMEIDMDKNSIIWYISDGRNNISPIPKLMQKLKLVPYFQMMDVGDEICFQE